MKILKIGTWNKHAFPVDWEIDMSEQSQMEWASTMGDIPVLEFCDTGEVYVAGIEIVPWTEERKRILEGIAARKAFKGEESE